MGSARRAGVTILLMDKTVADASRSGLDYRQYMKQEPWEAENVINFTNYVVTVKNPLTTALPPIYFAPNSKGWLG
jgi:hypothetical protein